MVIRFIEKMKSKTKIEKQTKRKTNPELVQTILFAKKSKEWLKIANVLSGSRRNRIDINIEKIDDQTKAGDIVVIPGKVLSLGEIDKKLRVCALGFSEKAKEKLLNSKCEVVSILDEIKKNPKATGVKILK